MTINEILRQKEKDLLKLIQIAEKNYGKPMDETLEISVEKGKPRYYLYYRDQNGMKHREYISPRTSLSRIRDLAQYAYTNNFLDTAHRQLAAVRAALKCIDERSLANVFAALHPARKKLVKPFVVDEDEYVKRWEAVEVPPSYFSPKIPEFYTERRERVRSKSEKIIADKYFMLNLPYRYEQPLVLMDRGRYVRVRPDFTVLNRRTQVQRYHEHLGRMDDPDYIAKSIYKLNLYESNGIYVGDQLILTYECSTQPLDMKHLDTLISRYFL